MELEKKKKKEFNYVSFLRNVGIIAHIDSGKTTTPNSGKSTLMNLLLNKERSLVTEIEGTTVEPVSIYRRR